MKNNMTEAQRIGVIILSAILLSSGMMWLMDLGLNGVFKEWFYGKFIVDPQFNLDGKLGVLFRAWYDIKLFITTAFFSLVMLLVFCAVIPAYFYARYKSKKDITFISDSMGSYIKSEDDSLTLPQKYSEIETQLVRIKAVSQRHQQLMQTEMQRKNDLITYLAHDLKTPLASVIGYLSLLDEAPDMPEAQKKKYVGVALDKAYRLEELINEFFDITRFNLHSVVLNQGKIKLAFMLEQIADEFYPMLSPYGKQVAINVPHDLILTGDADKLARVFNNILKNAAAYSYENSVIDITASLQGENAVIKFTNHGDAIPPQKLDTIFEKFYRLDSARSTNTGGAGLGLAIAKEIVEAHGGMISAESSPEYTAFTVTLPLSRP